MTNSLNNSARYKIFADRWPETEYARGEYNKLYQHWDSIWSTTFKELEGTKRFFSDDFDRLDEMTGIFIDGYPVGVFGFGFYDLRVGSHRNHSYFKAYPKKALDKLEEMGARTVMSMGNLGVSQEWRKREESIMSDALLGLGCKRFLESDADLLIAYTRNERKVNDLCYRHGAQCLVANHTEHNVSVDIIAITRESAIIAESERVLKFVNHLWQTKEVFGTARPYGAIESEYLKAA